MGTTSETKPKRYISVGLLAHVDSGKTTLSEGILYLTGQIRKPGRVDHGDAFLDNYALERQRGITIFSKQAVFQLGDSQVTLLDTPGHVDFSAEMERTLQVLDYAVLVGQRELMACRDTPARSGTCLRATGFRHSYLSIKWISRGRTRC